MGEPEENIDADVQLKTIATEVDRLLKRKGSIDESVAKGVRRSWDGLDQAKVTDTETYEATKVALEKLRDAVHRQVDKRDQSYGRLTGDIEKLEQAVKDGNLKTALSLEQSSTERLKQLEGLSDQRRDAASEKLVALGPEIKKLKQWRHWGTTQARETLIAEMEGLVGAKQSPAKIAQEVQRARTTWKSWDKTGDTSPKALWDKFDQACTKAYEPCQAHFDNLAEQRKANLQKRLKICEDMEQIEADTDWSSPAWRDMDRQVLDLVNGWRRAGPVDRRKRKKVETRYEAVFKKLDARFERERSRNVKQRTAMTAEVLELKESTDVAASIERVKDIQKQWRPTVLSSRRDERKLWREFKSACDDVFAVRDSERKTQSAEQEQNRSARQALLKTIESDMERGDKTVLSMNSRIDKLREQWNSAGSVMPKHRSGLEKQFRGVIKKLQTRARSIRNQREQKMDEFIASLDALLSQYETRFDDESASVVAADPISSLWPSVDQLSEPTRRSLNKRFSRIAAYTEESASLDEDIAALMRRNETLRQDICLKLEVAADIDTPAEFSQARMQWQVDRLKKAMTGSSTDEAGNDAESTRKLMRQYWAAGPVATGASQSLQNRFKQIASNLTPNLKIDLDFSRFVEDDSEDEPTVDSSVPASLAETSDDDAPAAPTESAEPAVADVDTSNRDSGEKDAAEKAGNNDPAGAQADAAETAETNKKATDTESADSSTVAPASDAPIGAHDDANDDANDGSSAETEAPADASEIPSSSR